MGTSTERREGAGLNAALCTGKPKAALFPTSADQQSLTSKPKGTVGAFGSLIRPGVFIVLGEVVKDLVPRCLRADEHMGHRFEVRLVDR
jgi:hypothetical protein